MSDKINPRLIEAGYVRQEDAKAKGGKVYRAAYRRGKSTRLGRRFATAREALAFAQKVKLRWVRLWWFDRICDAQSAADLRWTAFFNSAYDASKVVKSHASK